MANWPTYCIKLKGNINAAKKIEEILRKQTRGLYLELDIEHDNKYAEMTIGGETAWGVHNFNKVIELVVKNKMDLEVNQYDIQANTKHYGKWIKGKEIAWDIRNYQ